MTAPDSTNPLADIRARIAAAARAAGRDPADVALIAVSKQQTWETIEPVVRAGQKRFGENRVQEGMAHWDGRREGLTLHLIGPLQTNKARDAIAFFDAIESLDRPKLAQVLADEIQRAGRSPRLYVQVNIGEEPQKAGVAPLDADAFVAECRGLGLSIEGLMCVPPADEPPAPFFDGHERRLRNRDPLRRHLGAHRIGSVRRAGLRRDLYLIARPRQHQQSFEIGPGQGHAALGRRIALLGQVQEDRRTAPWNRRVVVVTEHDEEIIEPVIAPQRLAVGGVGQGDEAIVGDIVWRIAPAFARTKGRNAQRRAGRRPPVGPK
jgi:uncharacterized pyridoxal phosphate-containing UPF0001 family protein